MAENDFLPIAIEDVPNVQSQADYAGSRQQQQGFAVGEIPTSPAWNKMLRQSSCIMALLASLICANTGADMLDNGDQATKLALLSSMFRVRATADMNFYVANAPTGNDMTGDGSQAAPWATLQHMFDTVSSKYDGAGHALTMNAAHGTYAPVNWGVRPLGWKSINVIGDIAAPTSVIVHATTAATDAMDISIGSGVSVSGFQFKSDGGGGLSAAYGTTLNFGNCDFGACNLFQVSAFLAAYVQNTGNCTISGGATAFAFSGNQSTLILQDFNINITAAVNYGTAFIYANSAGCVTSSNMTFTNPGNVTGSRYIAQGMSLINTGGLGANYFPGTIAGTATQASNYF